ncbi:MAG: M1 family metallopeptidase [Chloroflexota bacterium]
MTTRKLGILCILGALLLAACAPAAPAYGAAPPDLVTADPNASATATPFQPGGTVDAVVQNIILTEIAGWTETPAATETSTPKPASPTPAATATTGPTAPASNDLPGGSRTLYTLYATLDYYGHAAAVNQTVRYTNNTGRALSSIVMSVEPNQWPGCFSLSSLEQDGAAVSSYTLAGHRLTIPLTRPLDAGATTTFTLGYSLDLPWKSADGTFGYRTDQLNLTNWYPFIVPFDGDWVLHDPSTYGEYLVYDSADFDVNIKVDDPGVVLAASAPGEANGNSTRYHLEGARTFVISASDSYGVDETAVGPVKIMAYHLPGHENANDAVIWMATQSVGLYQVKFAPYPYTSLTIIESDIQDGQEFDGVVFLASKFYSEYNGSARSNLFSIGTHEIAHQWWFGLVGSDQASEPWLDEALSVYSERIFYEYNHPGYGDWWWGFRVNYFGPSGYVDQGVYGFGTFRGYVNAVYLNGANFLDELRTRVGDEAFFSFLKDYAQSYARQRATARDFFAVLGRHTNRDFSDILGAYLQGHY